MPEQRRNPKGMVQSAQMVVNPVPAKRQVPDAGERGSRTRDKKMTDVTTPKQDRAAYAAVEAYKRAMAPKENEIPKQEPKND